MIVMGVDPGVRFIGWARGEPGARKPISGVFEVPDFDGDDGAAIVTIETWLHAEIQSSGIRHIWYEEAFPNFYKGRINVPLFWKHVTVINTIQACAKRHGFTAMQVRIKDWRDDMLGGSSAPKNVRNESTWFKDRAKAECARRGWLTENHHKAEAQLIWDYACRVLDPNYRFKSNPDMRRRQDRMAMEMGAML